MSLLLWLWGWCKYNFCFGFSMNFEQNFHVLTHQWTYQFVSRRTAQIRHIIYVTWILSGNLLILKMTGFGRCFMAMLLTTMNQLKLPHSSFFLTITRQNILSPIISLWHLFNQTNHKITGFFHTTTQINK